MEVLHLLYISPKNFFSFAVLQKTTTKKTLKNKPRDFQFGCVVFNVLFMSDQPLMVMRCDFLAYALFCQEINF